MGTAIRLGDDFDVALLRVLLKHDIRCLGADLLQLIGDEKAVFLI